MEAAIGRAGRDRLLRMVADHARRGPALIATATPEGARREAHGLRGAVGSVGAERLAAALHAIEHGPTLSPGDERLTTLRREADAVADAAEALLG